MDSINIFVGVIKDTPDKDTYKCSITIPGGGNATGIPTRVENEPKTGDEVLCIKLPDPYGNDVLYIPLKTLSGESFTGIARQGYKLEFSDSGIEITTSSGASIKIGDNTLEINGFSTSIKIPGTVTPTGTGPFCGLPKCLFSGAPHTGDTISNN